MSMLAERKIKTKWSLNPRGKAWSQDSNKFGQKMLEKMGWQQGQGLGPDGKGIIEHIKVSYKNDSKGMGYKESDDQWTENEENFASLLESLNGGATKSDEVKLNSLERKSEASKARVHYHKFTRGKDISRYSEKDLANIFGKKTLKESKREKEEEESDRNKDKHKYDSTLLVNAGSMRDYFKKKLPNFGKSNGFVVGRNGVLKKEDSGSESEARPGFGHKLKHHTNNYEGGKTKNMVTLYENTQGNLPTGSDSKNKSKERAMSTFKSYLGAKETNFNKTDKKKRKGEECNEHSVLSPRKKSKKEGGDTPKKKLKVKSEENKGLSNPAFDPLPTPVKLQRHVLNTIQESMSEDSVLEENFPKVMQVEAEVYVNTPKEKCEVGKHRKTPKKGKPQNIGGVSKVYNSEEKKLKKKKKISNGLGNDVTVKTKNTPKKLDLLWSNPSVEGKDYTKTEENSCEVKVKKKKNSKKEEQFEVNSYEMKAKVKRKNKIKDVILVMSNPSFDGSADNSTDSSQVEENSYEVKVKENKKKKTKEAECVGSNSSLEGFTASCQVGENLYEMKAKEKKIKEAKCTLSNPGFDVPADSSTSSSQVEDNPYEVKVKQKKKKKTKDKKFDPGNDSADNSTDSSQFEENSYGVKGKEKKIKEAKYVLSNSSFDISADSSTSSSQVEENPYEMTEKEKKKKKVKDEILVSSNLSFDGSDSNSTDSSQLEENPYEVKVTGKKKKKAKHEKFAVSNPGFDGSANNSTDCSQVEENPYEVKEKKKKKARDEIFALSNPSFDGSADNSTDSSQVEENPSGNPYEVKVKKKKKVKDEKFALSNPSFDGSSDNSTNSSRVEENPYEVKVKDKKKKKVKEETFALSNPSFNDSSDNFIDSSQVEENPYEVKVKKKKQHEKERYARDNESSCDIRDKKKRKKQVFAIDNPYFDSNDSLEADTKNNMLEVERKKKKQKKTKEEGGIVNPALNLDSPQSGSKEVVLEELDESDIMLNVVSTPIITKSTPGNKESTFSIKKVNGVKRAKSVRFSDITEERIIPNNDDLGSESEIEISSTDLTNDNSEADEDGVSASPLSSKENQNKRSKKRKLGLDNAGFDKHMNTLEENLNTISKTLDMYQAEIENDINENKLEMFQMDNIMVGEVGNPHGENEKVPDGSMLRFKYAHFKGQTPFYQLNKTGSKKSYKHLIKGDIVVKFKNSNLHEIGGYAVEAKSTV